MYYINSAQPEIEVERWDRSKDLCKKVTIKAPNIVTIYNKYIWGC